MNNTKPIRILLLVSLVCYAAYAVFYAGILFAQPYSTQLFGGMQDLAPYYDWMGLVLVGVSAAARVLLYVLVMQHLRPGDWRSFSVIGIYYLVLVVALPAFAAPIYYTVSMRIVAYRVGANGLAALSMLRAAQGFVAPLASIANYAAFAGCTIAWYRNSLLRRGAAANTGSDLPQPPGAL